MSDADVHAVSDVVRDDELHADDDGDAVVQPVAVGVAGADVGTGDGDTVTVWLDTCDVVGDSVSDADVHADSDAVPDSELHADDDGDAVAQPDEVGVAGADVGTGDGDTVTVWLDTCDVVGDSEEVAVILVMGVDDHDDHLEKLTFVLAESEGL